MPPTRSPHPNQEHRHHHAAAIPAADDPHAIAVTDGTAPAGWIVERDGSHFAFSPGGELIGRYSTRAAAVAALPDRP